jgi:glycerol-3-phosphate dehydrogenase
MNKSADNNSEDCDILIVGGGIHGAGAAQACAAAGYRCVLVEKNDWGWATSSRSSKLLHGGLRYLQTGQLKLVRECLQERERLLRNAPDLAHINWFYLPLYHHSHYRPWKIFCGLSLYRLFTGLTNPHGSFRIVPRSQWGQLYGLNTQDLRAVFAYQDAQTDDRLLTQAVKNSAIHLGVSTLCPAELLHAEKTVDGWRATLSQLGNSGKNSDDTHTGYIKINCRVIVNASGPWVNHVIARCGSKKQLPVDLVQGSHVILKKKISDHCFYLEASDQRAVFILPWYEYTLVGTTEKIFTGKPEDTQASQEEIDYLLTTVSQHFPNADITIKTAFSGLRVLPTSTERAFLRQRDTQFLNDNGLISLYGGKLTAYHATSEQLLQHVQQQLGTRKRIADTRVIPLYRETPKT